MKTLLCALALAACAAVAPNARCDGVHGSASGSVSGSVSGTVSGTVSGSVSGSVNAGIDVHPQSSMQEIGLPVYPGAKLAAKDGEGEDGNVSMSLWGGSFGMKLLVAKYQSSDGIDAVQAFYRDALARYGKVLDCGGASLSAGASDSRTEIRLSCDRDDRREGKHVLKVGASDKDFRLVALKQEGKLVTIDVVRLVIKGD